jgi:hypothetical protein
MTVWTPPWFHFPPTWHAAMLQHQAPREGSGVWIIGGEGSGVWIIEREGQGFG